MYKNCILYDNKTCDNCGECDICDIDPGKICDNCGKCLEGYDYTGIQVDDLVVDEPINDEIDNDYQGDSWKLHENEAFEDEDDNTLFIDDIEGLTEEIEHEHNHCHDHDHNHNN